MPCVLCSSGTASALDIQGRCHMTNFYMTKFLISVPSPPQMHKVHAQMWIRLLLYLFLLLVCPCHLSFDLSFSAVKYTGLPMLLACLFTVFFLVFFYLIFLSKKIQGRKVAEFNEEPTGKEPGTTVYFIVY